jgi:hypothetical protein
MRTLALSALVLFDSPLYARKNTNVFVMRRLNAFIGDLIPYLPEHGHTVLRYGQGRLKARMARSLKDDEEKLKASKEDRQGLGVAHQGQY